MSFHKTIIMGNLGRDPEVRYAANGDAIANFSVAITEKYQEQERTTWYRVSVFGKQAEAAGKHLKKGASVLVEGRMGERKWQDKEGVERTTWELRADLWRFAGGRASGSSDDQPSERQQSQTRQRSAPSTGGGSGFDDFEDDIPF
jgi:single-strand DNA-binding protein